MTDERESPSTWPSHQHYPPAPESAEADELDIRKNLAGPRGLEPLPFAAPSLARRAPEPEPEPEPKVEPEVQLEPAMVPVTAADEEPESRADPQSRADWATAPLEGLGLVQLVQRLGSTIERRREWTAQCAAPAAVAAPFASTPADFEPAPADEAAQAMAAFFSSNPPPVVDAPLPDFAEAEAETTFEPAPAEPEPEPEPEPVAMPRPGFLHSFALQDDEVDSEDAVPDFSLPLRRPAAAAPAFAPADNDAEEEEVSEETNDDQAGEEAGYSSLLGMSNPFAAPKTQFVRIEEPVEEAELVEPAVVFPGQEEPARSAEPAPAFASRLFDAPGKAAAPAVTVRQVPADADAALRAALATLQRMGGAA